MSSIEELIKRARDLHSEGHPDDQIADELSLSTDTVAWLLTQDRNSGAAPKDVHIDWTAVSMNASLLDGISEMLMVNFESHLEDTDKVDTVVGLSVSGVPLASLIAAQHGLSLAIFHPSKHNPHGNGGSLSGNFSKVSGKNCVIIDDCITTGNTLKETVSYIRSHKGNPIGICVIFDKRGLREVDGIPVYSLFNVKRID